MIGQSINNVTSHSSHGTRPTNGDEGNGPLHMQPNQRQLSKPILNVGTIDLLSNIPLPDKPPLN